MDQVVMYLGAELEDDEPETIQVGDWEEAKEKLAQINAKKDAEQCQQSEPPQSN